MDHIFESYKKTGDLHHAYLIEEDGGPIHEKILLFAEKELGMTIVGNPDIWHRTFEKFGIDEGRMLRELQANKAFSGTKRLFIITTQFFTREAQNALLKVFEEPSSDTHFFIITPRADVLLPTLRSRLFVISRKDGANGASFPYKKEAEAFLEGSGVERIKIVQPIIEDKDKVAGIAMLNALEAVLASRGTADLSAYVPCLDDIMKSRGYLYGNAPSVKMIFEHLVVSVPRLTKGA